MSKPKVIFWHTYLVNDYRLVVQDQILKIVTSGLYAEVESIFTGIIAPQKEDAEWFVSLLKAYPKFIPLIHESNVDEEKATMRHIASYAKTKDAYIAYFHMKGITDGYPNKYIRTLWRHSMDYAVLYKWRECIGILEEGADAVGPNLRFDCLWGRFPHFSGTYWWSQSAYINTLDLTYVTDSNTKYPFNRFLVEFWIGSNPSGKLKSVFECGSQYPHDTECTIDRYLVV